MIDRRMAKEALLTWGLGRPFLSGESASGAAVVMVEDASHVGDVVGSGVVRDGGVVLAPSAGLEVTVSDRVEVVSYEGNPSEPAGEISVGDDVFVQHQDYSTAEYMTVIGPTLLRLFVPEDFEALMSDLDQAVAGGQFPEYLVHPAAQLGDRSALGGHASVDGPHTRLHLRADGTWSVGPFGAPLGVLGDDFSVLETAWRQAAGGGASVPVAGVVPDDVRTAALAARPWVGHALSVVTALQELAARRIGGSIAVSGFGRRLNPELADLPCLTDSPWAAADASTPVLAWTDNEAYLHIPDRSRTFRIPRDVAIAFEAVIVTGSTADAARLAPADLVEAVVGRLAAEGVPTREAVA